MFLTNFIFQVSDHNHFLLVRIYFAASLNTGRKATKQNRRVRRGGDRITSFFFCVVAAHDVVVYVPGFARNSFNYCLFVVLFRFPAQCLVRTATNKSRSFRRMIFIRVSDLK